MKRRTAPDAWRGDHTPTAATLSWRSVFDDDELGQLHAACFGADVRTQWWEKVNRHSLGWVCTRQADELIGFLNVAWDGGSHAFLLDVVVAEPARCRGVATRMIALAAEQARCAGCKWLHVDFEEQLSAFYLESCGFSPTAAGLLKLRT